MMTWRLTPGSLAILFGVSLAALAACSSDDGETNGSAGTTTVAGAGAGGSSAAGSGSGGKSTTAGSAGSSGSSSGGAMASGGTSSEPDAGGAGGEAVSGAGGESGGSGCGAFGQPCCDAERPCLGRLACLTDEQTGEKECGVLPNAKQ